MKDRNDAKIDRRVLLGALGVGTGIAATTGTLSISARADSETNDEKSKSRYKETDHVKAFYRVNKYPT
jgi:hypothetical protein